MVEPQGADKQRYVAEMFTRIARRYDLMNSLMTGGQHHRWKARAARLACHELAGPALDVATGTGDLALALARRPGINPVVGLDFLPPMLALAQGKARRRRLSSQVAWLAGDAVAMPFCDNSFACATAGFSLRNMPEPGGVRRALAEMVRVVRPGGRVAILELTPLRNGSGTNSLVRIGAGAARFYSHRLVPILGGMVAGDRLAYTYLPQSVDRFLDAEALASLLRELGLVQVEYRRLGFGTVAIHWGVKPNTPQPL
ncbi:MAG: ubiquinone/menaquinone biosynthesis methyltransferase [Dehalococcoidia bacterium]|nr:ubiquinone/menaquinone biosynthesis methyltransferase [Dehalococcoidia bacterium]MSQ16465.1 ubiquinone/menaquinone biosynthesis methyltransferase [Dehalococcoidia bacterium]